MKRITVDERIAQDAIKPQDRPHIVLAPEKCRSCTLRPCLHACPARLYTLADSGEVRFEHAGCLECGTCLALCPSDLDWHYPAGGFGVQYRHG